MTTVAEFLSTTGIVGTFAPLPSPAGREWGGQHYAVTFTRPDRPDVAPMVVDFTDSRHNAEIGERSTVAEVWSCVASDVAMAEDAATPGALARDLGIEDVDQAIATHAALIAQRDAFRLFLTADEYAVALWEVDPE